MIPDPIESLRDLLDRTPALSRADLEELASAGRKLDDDPAFVADLNKSRFVESLLQAMDARGVSQSELARRWGKTRQYVSKVFDEDRRVNFTLESMAELCHLLGLRLDVRALQEAECAHVMTVHRKVDFAPSPTPGVIPVEPVSSAFDLTTMQAANHQFGGRDEAEMYA
jgi:antitoxin component HigA of HigAB toxin-antitoxin module